MYLRHFCEIDEDGINDGAGALPRANLKKGNTL